MTLRGLSCAVLPKRRKTREALRRCEAPWWHRVGSKRAGRAKPAWGSARIPEQNAPARVRSLELNMPLACSLTHPALTRAPLAVFANYASFARIPLADLLAHAPSSLTPFGRFVRIRFAFRTFQGVQGGLSLLERAGIISAWLTPFRAFVRIRFALRTAAANFGSLIVMGAGIVPHIR